MKKILNIIFLLTLITFTSCEKDLYEDAIQENKRNIISLEQFKTETGINDFEKIIKIPFSNQSASQNKIAGLEDFIIDTEEILRRISNDNKTTYSFRIYPMDSNIEINQIFNLIYRKEDGIWEKSILSMIEDSPNQSFRTVSSVKEIFDTKHQVTMVEACYSTTQITFCDGRCSGNCDAKSPGGCSENTCHVFVAVVIGDCAEAGSGPQNPDIENPSNSGNSGYIPVNPYEFQPNLYDNPAYDDPDYLNAIKSDIFFSHLTPGEQTWTNETQENILAYNQLINYMIVNNWSPECVSFGNAFIAQSTENQELKLSVEASSKSPAFVDMSAIDNSTPEGAKFNLVYNELMKSPKFKELFIDLFQNNDRFNVKFQIGAVANGANGNTDTDLENPTQNTITISPQFLLSKNKMEIAKTIIHECIHAYLNVKLCDAGQGMSIPTLNNMDFYNVVNQEYNGFSPGQNQHNFIYNYMIPTMVTILSEVKDFLVSPADNAEIQTTVLHPYYPNINPSTSFNWSECYFYLSSDGLQNCSFFQNEIGIFNTDGTFNTVVDLIKMNLIKQYKDIRNANLH